jgi:hypothetical protein
MKKKIVWENLDFKEEQILDMISGGDKEFEEDRSDKMPETLYQGPFGMESILDPMAISQRLNLIIGHTNFNISARLSNVVQKTVGVDVLKVLSRYSFLFSPGKAFNEDDVKYNIEKNMGVYSEKTEFNIDEYTKDITGSYCVYVRNGKISCYTEEDESFLDMVQILRESKEKYGGELYERAIKEG